MIALYSENVYWEINLNTSVCIKGSLNSSSSSFSLQHHVNRDLHLISDAPFIPHGVPADAQFDGQFYIGSDSAPGAGVLTEAWSANVTTSTGTIQYFTTLTAIDCFPVRAQYVEGSSYVIEE